MAKHQTIIGVDLGGTKVLAGKVQTGKISASFKAFVPKEGTAEEVIQAICLTIDKVYDTTVSGIGIGVPSIVDVKKGIVYEVQNIPSWKEVYLKAILENKYKIPVQINNDANCFAVGEKYFGKGRNHENFVALICGTGIAAGLILHNKLYNGFNCGAGEFGMLPYLDHHLEYYASGQFFTNMHQIDGAILFHKAKEGDLKALAIFEAFGHHLGNAINTILYTIDPELIILGGSVAEAYPFFKKTLWKSIGQLAYPTIVERLKIEVSTNPNIAVLGAAALCYD